MIYTPLDRLNGEIRLLTPQPCRLPYDGGPATLCYRLRNVPLDTGTKYNALSYVWGNDPPEHSIIINDQEISIRPNLYSALCRVRTQSPNGYLWCDAICIDQANNREKNHEVLRMGDIYSRAEIVIIWLGEHAQNSDRAIQHIENWSAVAPTLLEAETKLPLTRLADTLLDRTAWEAIRSLFDRPWWRRMWTLQEVALSRSAVLLCGSAQCDWKSLIWARTAWEILKTPSGLLRVPIDWVDLLPLLPQHDVGAAAISLHARKFSNSRMSFLSLLRLVSSLDATNPRDKLYALLGLKEVVDITIIPEYGDTLRKVYTDFVVAFVRNKNRLSILAGAGNGTIKGLQRDLPSWVLDLRETLPMVDDYTQFAAAGQTNAMASFSTDFSTLSAQGLLVATIEQLAPRPQTDLLGRTDWVDLVLSQDLQYHPTGIPQIQAYFRTLIGDSSNKSLCEHDFQNPQDSERFYNLAIGFLYVIGSLIPERSKFKHNSSGLSGEEMKKIEHFNDYVRVFANFVGALPASISEDDILEPFLGAAGLASRLQWPLTTDRKSGRDCCPLFAETMAMACRNRSLFVTQQGYIGLAPPGTEQGDLLCILYGCELPLILRRAGEKFSLVGQCYVYGLMHDEVLQDTKAGRGCIQKFDLI